MTILHPHLPQNIPAFAQECLTAIAQAGLGSHLSIGGAFGLAHYYEYRTTHDIDAWWATDATRVIRSQIISVIEKTLSVFGQIRTRAWGDVVSIDLRQNNRTFLVFKSPHDLSCYKPKSLAFGKEIFGLTHLKI